jgi:hypothetical protein
LLNSLAYNKGMSIIYKAVAALHKFSTKIRISNTRYNSIFMYA